MIATRHTSDRQHAAPRTARCAVLTLFMAFFTCLLCLQVGCDQSGSASLTPRSVITNESPTVDDADAPVAMADGSAVALEDAAAGANNAANNAATKDATPIASPPPAPSNTAKAVVEPAAARPRIKEGIQDVTFDTIKLEIEKDQAVTPEMLTPEVKQIDGQRIRIRGYMLPSFQQSGIRSFILVRDNQQCCFGPGAALHDCIRVDMTGEHSAEFSVLPIAVEGVFHIRDYLDPEDGHQLAIYYLEATSAK